MHQKIIYQVETHPKTLLLLSSRNASKEHSKQINDDILSLVDDLESVESVSLHGDNSSNISDDVGFDGISDDISDDISEDKG